MMGIDSAAVALIPEHRNIIAAAIRLSKLGIPVHWLYGPTDDWGGKLPPKSRGKAVVGEDWQKRGFQNAETLASTYKEGFNLGIHTGRVEGSPYLLWGLDFDSEDTLAWALSGAIPLSTLRTRTRKGEHWFYLIHLNAPLINNKIKKIRPLPHLEIDLIADGKGDGHNLVCAPSIHVTGFDYSEVEPWNAEALAACPYATDGDVLASWFAELIDASEEKAVQANQLSNVVSLNPKSERVSSRPILEIDLPARPSNVMARARKYAEHVDASIAGANGSAEAFRLAQALTCGFCLTDHEALFVMKEDWNRRCTEAGSKEAYPWSDDELLHKIQDSRDSERLPGPKGWLLDEARQVVKQSGDDESEILAELVDAGGNVSAIVRQALPDGQTPRNDIKFKQFTKHVDPRNLLNRGIIADLDCNSITLWNSDGSDAGTIGILMEQFIGYAACDLGRSFLEGKGSPSSFVFTRRLTDVIALASTWRIDEPAPAVIAVSDWNAALNLCAKIKTGIKVYFCDADDLDISDLISRLRIAKLYQVSKQFIEGGADAVKRAWDNPFYFDVSGLDEGIKPQEHKRLWECDDIANGQRLIAYFGHDLRYVPRWGEWLVWDGRKWTIDELGVIWQLAKKTRAYILKERDLVVASGDVALTKSYRDWYQETGMKSRISHMVKHSQTEKGVSLRASDLDKNGFLFNTLNGTINLHSGQFSPHSREDYQTKLSRVVYDPEAKCPLWEKCLATWMQGNERLVNYLQRVVGYILTGSVSETCFFIFWGDGQNGKSTFILIVKKILGDLAKGISSDLLMASKKDASSPTYMSMLASLAGARLAIATETEAHTPINESQIKTMTSEEEIPAKFMAKNIFEFTPSHKIVITTNHKPPIQNTDKGIWRRVKMVPFTAIIKDKDKDPALKSKLETELSGILNWALKGCADWLREGLNDPPEIDEAISEYRQEMNPIADFIDDCLITDKEGDAEIAMLNDTYGRWFQDQKGSKPDGRAMYLFARHLENNGFKRAQRGHDRVRVRTGIRFNPASKHYQMALGNIEK